MTRTEYRAKDGSKTSGEACKLCTTSYVACTTRLFSSQGEPCCSGCGYTKTHGVEERTPPPGKADVAEGDYVVVTVRPSAHGRTPYEVRGTVHTHGPTKELWVGPIILSMEYVTLIEHKPAAKPDRAGLLYDYMEQRGDLDMITGLVIIDPKQVERGRLKARLVARMAGLPLEEAAGRADVALDVILEDFGIGK